jgi:hypothetical protein
MKIDNKKLLIGGAVLAVGTAVYLFLKTKRNKSQVGILDDESIEFDYNNAGGKDISSNIASGIEKPLSINDYNTSIEKALNDKKYQNYIGKKIYTLVDNVNVRMGANVNNGIFHNKAGTIPKKKTFIGKVVTVKLGDDKKLWFAVNEENSNKLYDVKKHFNWSIYLEKDPSLRWFRSDVIVVKLDKK